MSNEISTTYTMLVPAVNLVHVVGFLFSLDKDSPGMLYAQERLRFGYTARSGRKTGSQALYSSYGTRFVPTLLTLFSRDTRLRRSTNNRRQKKARAARREEKMLQTQQQKREKSYSAASLYMGCLNRRFDPNQVLAVWFSQKVLRVLRRAIFWRTRKKCD